MKKEEKVKRHKPTLAELVRGVSNKEDPAVYHPLRVLDSIHIRMHKAGNVEVNKTLNEHLPK